MTVRDPGRTSVGAVRKGDERPDGRQGPHLQRVAQLNTLGHPIIVHILEVVTLVPWFVVARTTLCVTALL